jgi:hypothetical protein
MVGDHLKWAQTVAKGQQEATIYGKGSGFKGES